ncbi:MAG: RNA polymerase sigma factor region1.1 domain-containing protein, partial [Clostridia bacterium]
MEITEKFLQEILEELRKKEKEAGYVTFDEVEEKLEKIDLTPEQNAEIYKFLDENNLSLMDIVEEVGDDLLLKGVADVPLDDPVKMYLK